MYLGKEATRIIKETAQLDDWGIDLPDFTELEGID